MKKLFFVVILGLLAQFASAQNLELPGTFGTGMVIQQQTDVKFWGWARPDSKVKVKVSWSKEKFAAIADEKGEWMVTFHTPEASFDPLKITVTSGKEKIVLSDILAGDVWFVSGQSNMEMDFRGNPDQPTNDAQKIMLRANHPGIRLYREKDGYAVAQSDTLKPEGQWKYLSPESVKTFSVIGYIFGEKIYQMEHIPIGLVQSAHGGSVAEAWLDLQTLKDFNGGWDLDFTSRDMDQVWYALEPNLLYNKMLEPLLPMSIKGVIWYQGESNAEKPQQYLELFPLLIKKWREYFENQDMPFYYVQITPEELYPTCNSAELRESQLKVQDLVENVGMAVALDVGEYKVDHPARKEVLGERLAYWALNKDYGHTAFGCRGPEVDKLTEENGKAVLTFKYAPNGLSFFGKEVNGFQVAGEDRVFYPAEARIKPAFWGNEGLEVWSEKVPHPVAVRYGYTNWVDGCLYNTEGLPASSFRTDDWEAETVKQAE